MNFKLNHENSQLAHAAHKGLIFIFIFWRKILNKKFRSIHSNLETNIKLWKIVIFNALKEISFK